MAIEPWGLAAMNLGRLQGMQYEVAVLPTAAIEAHNRHLPEGQDFLHTTYVARTSCAAAWEKSARVICLPAIPYGVDCNLMDFPLTIHVSQATLDAMVRDIIVSVRHRGIRKVVIVNGHGGNDFTPLVRQIQCDLDVHVFLIDWWWWGRINIRRFSNCPTTTPARWRRRSRWRSIRNWSRRSAPAPAGRRRFVLKR